MGGKVQAPGGYANHVVFVDPALCDACGAKVCIEVCSGQAISPAPGVPRFDREKCVHCGACVWSCTGRAGGLERGNIELRAGAGGLHSVEN
jgi:electron-transferring-flavoprotein dehydrogenase